MAEYFHIGKLVASFGFNGEIVLKHSLGKRTSFNGLEKLFIEESKDSLLPYFIEKSTIKSETETLVKLEGIISKEGAKRLMQKLVWLEEADFKKFAKSSAPISLLGYNVISDGADLGKIIEVIEQPHQVLCTIIYKGNEALIPVHDQNLKKIDKKNQCVYLDLPEGLLEIYG